MVLDNIKSQIKKWRNSTSGRESQKITPEEISLKGTSLASIKGTPLSISTDEGIYSLQIYSLYSIIFIEKEKLSITGLLNILMKGYMSQSSSLTSTSNRLKLSVSSDFHNKQITTDETAFKETEQIRKKCPGPLQH